MLKSILVRLNLDYYYYSLFKLCFFFFFNFFNVATALRFLSRQLVTPHHHTGRSLRFIGMTTTLGSINSGNNGAEGDDTASTKQQSYYFESYAHYGIHHDMLSDVARTTAYRDAIQRNAYFFKGKTVLDVGCGTGILSLFAARAGAKRVIAVEYSSIAEEAKKIVESSQYSNVITVIRGKMEDVNMPPDVTTVDIIISEWMGYFLLYETMLTSVLKARDRWGSKDVVLLPSHATMYACGISDEDYYNNLFKSWDSMDGFECSFLKQRHIIEPVVDGVNPNQIITSVEEINSLNLRTLAWEDIPFEKQFTLTIQTDSAKKLHGICVHFDTPFAGQHDTSVTLSTAPWAQSTHWRQTILYLHEPFWVLGGDELSCQLQCKPNEFNSRDWDIRLSLSMPNGKHSFVDYHQDYRLR